MRNDMRGEAVFSACWKDLQSLLASTEHNYNFFLQNQLLHLSYHFSLFIKRSFESFMCLGLLTRKEGTQNCILLQQFIP